MLICLSIKIKFKTNNENNIAPGTIPANNFFTHWLKEVDIKRYGDDIPILPFKTVKYIDTRMIWLNICLTMRLKHSKKHFCSVKKGFSNRKLRQKA